MKLLSSSLALLALVAATSYAVAGETSYDVCVNLARDVRVSGSSYVTVGKIFPGGTITNPSAAACPSSGNIGTFFSRGAAVLGLANAGRSDLAFVTWHFRINGKGAFDTVGAVEGFSVSKHPQTIIGSTNDVAPRNVEATVNTPETTPFDAFRISLRSGSQS